MKRERFNNRKNNNKKKKVNSDCLGKYASFIAAYPTFPRNIQKKVTTDCDKDFTHLICEICFNILRKNVPLSSNQISELRKYKRPIKILADRTVSLSKKKRLISQKGGGFFLPLLFSTLGPLVIDQISKLFPHS